MSPLVWVALTLAAVGTVGAIATAVLEWRCKK